MIRTTYFLFFLLFFLVSLRSTGQNCASSTDTSISCLASCADLSSVIPDIRPSTDYSVTSIPYCPYDYETNAPALSSNCTDKDDKFLDTTLLPFPFCFYGQIYTRLVIGTNAVVTFDSTMALRANHYFLSGNQLPYAGGTQPPAGNCLTPGSSVYYPRASIMGVYHDIIPRSTENYKIEARTEGIAPSRRFVISFSNVSMFGCAGLKSTSQIVIYEGTGIIEVYVKDKPTCSSNGNRGIIGIQNWARDKGLAAPGRNCESFTTSNEAWRFTPNGSGFSQFNRVELYKNGSLIATGDTIGIGNNRLKATFTNICQTETFGTYIVKAFYQNCSNPLEEAVVQNTINVTKTAGTMTTSVAPAPCGQAQGSITVTDPVGANYEYSIDGANWQTSNVFSVAPGTYTVRVRVVGSSCITTKSVTVSASPSFTVGTSVTNTNCNASTGSITVTTTGGSAPFTYSLDGVNYQTSNVFSNLAAGTYTIRTKDATGCIVTVSEQVNTTSGVTATATATNATCSSSNGTITVNASSGVTPYTYSINGGTFQASNTFTGLAPGSYSITVKDANGCTFTFTQSVSNTGGATATASSTNTSCASATNGSITVNATGGVTPYTYAIDGGAFQSSNIFTGLASGPHSIQVKDANNCIFTLTQNVGSNAGTTATATATNASCTGVSDGTITVNASGGVTPYSYSIDGGAPQTSNVFTGLTQGTHNIQVKDAANCTFSFTQTIGTNGGATATATTTNASCGAAANGTITVNATGGATPYSYSVDGGAFQTSNVFTGLASGSHTIQVKDAANCIFTFSEIIGTNGGPTATATSTNTACSTASNGTLTVTASAGQSPYTYAVDGGAYQSSNTFTGLTAGAHSVQVKDAANCVYTFNHSISFNTGVTATSSTQPATCSTATNGSVTITAANGSGPYTYAVDGGTFQSSNVFNGLATGNHTYQVNDASNCSYSGNFTIASGSGITATTSVNNAACPGSASGSITVTPAAGTTPYSYALNGGTPQSSNVFTGLVAGTYSITVKDAGGCTVAISATIANNPGVTATATATSPGCPGSATGSITVNASAGSGPYTYQLNGGTSQTSNVFSNLQAGTYIIRVTDAGSCFFEFSQTLTSRPAIDAQLTISNPTCNGSSNGSIAVTPVNGTAPFQYALNTGAFQTSNTFSNLATGSYTVHIRDNLNCTKDTTVTLSQPGGLTASASSTPATCSGNADGSVNITASGGTTPYLYSIDNGTNFQSNNVIPAKVGSYNIVVKDNQGCTANASASVILNDTMRLSLGPDTTSCFGSPITLIPNTNAATNGFVWTPAAGLDNPSARNPKATPTDTTTYFLTATWGICTRKDTITVNVKRRPVANAGLDTTICDRSSATLTGSASNLSGTVNYSWSPAGQVSPVNSQTTTATPLSTGRNTFTLTVSDNYGCNFNVTDDVVVTMNPKVPANAGNDTIAARGLSHQLFGSGGVSFLWSPAAPLDNPIAKNPVAKLFADTRFTLIVVDNAGCIGYDTVNIKVYKGPAYYVPTAFTPNGDGLNDIFRAIPPGIVQTEYFRVFNRWGQMVFSTNQYMKGWDGTYQGKPQQNGVYSWIVRGLDKFGSVVEQRGTVVLLR